MNHEERMTISDRHMRGALGIAALLLASNAGWAQETAPPSEFTLSGSVGGVSDYRFRGVSRSGEDPAVQGSLEVSHSSGFYAGTWASTLGDAVADVEGDVYAGWSGTTGLATINVGVLGYLFAGAGDRDYYEVYGSAGWSLGPATATLGVNYAPDQSNIGSKDNVYLYGSLGTGIPNTPVTLKARLGYENGAFGGPDGDKLDWSLGAEYKWEELTFGVSYVDTDISGVDTADAGVVLSLTAGF